MVRGAPGNAPAATVWLPVRSISTQRHQHAAHQHSGNAKHHRNPAALGALFFAGIQQA